MISHRKVKRYSETTHYTTDGGDGGRDALSNEIAAAALLVVMAMFAGLTVLYFALK